MNDTPNRRNPPWLQEIKHTGDVGLVIHASTCAELFERAAWGMFSVVADLERVAGRESRNISLEADDREALLVAWLSELNFIHCTEHLVFSEFTIEHLDDHALSATVGGEPIDTERHTIYTEIKAVTYHGLVLEETSKGWRLEVIFDM
jgi:SHS2 domain-containing protein